MTTLSTNWFGLEPVSIDAEPTKVCSRCGIRKPVSEYHHNRWRKHGYMDECKSCVSSRAQNYYNSNGNMKSRLRIMKRRDPDMTLTEEEINGMWQEQGGKCYYSGLDMTLDPGHKETWSVDRVDPSKGYNLENCVLCCSAVNMMKQDFELPEFRRYIAAIYERNSAKEGENDFNGCKI